MKIEKKKEKYHIQMMYYDPMMLQMQLKVMKDFHVFVVVGIHVELFSFQYFVLIVQYQDFYVFLMVHLIVVVF